MRIIRFLAIYMIAIGLLRFLLAIGHSLMR